MEQHELPHLLEEKEFHLLSEDQKIQKISEKVKLKVQQGEDIPPSFFMLDQHDKMHLVEVNEKFFQKSSYQYLLKKLIRNKVEQLQQHHDTHIKKILFFTQGFYNKELVDKKNVNLDKDFHKNNANEAFMIMIEDLFDVNIQVFDLIQVSDAGKKIAVLSKDPIDEINFCKIDPDYNVKTQFINILQC